MDYYVNQWGEKERLAGQVLCQPGILGIEARGNLEFNGYPEQVLPSFNLASFPGVTGTP